MESLEDRRLLALYVVNNFGDLNPDQSVVVGSLRQAVQLSNGNGESDTIVFADYLFDGGFGGTINLDGRPAGGELPISEDDGLQIIGPGPGLLTIVAGGNNRIFSVDDGDENNFSSNSISGVTLSSGNPNGDDRDGLGGAIFNNEVLTLTEVDISNNNAAGGGGVFNSEGRLTIDRSLIRDNISDTGGGGIQNGALDQTENLPNTTILNSTITGNLAIGIPSDEAPTGYGGGVLNQAGYVTIEQSTIYGNEASVDGGGVASRGFDPERDDETGDATVYAGLATTDFRSTIIAGNTSNGMANDVASSGMTEGDEENPPEPFEPQMNSLGYNLFGTLTHPTTSENMTVTLPPGGPSDASIADPSSLFIDDPLSDPMDPEPWLNDFGGVLPVFMPDLNKAGGLMAIDMGDPNVVMGEFDNRGFQFERAADLAGGMMPVMDIGAAEVQVGTFEVTTLDDETDGRYADVAISEGFFPINILTFVPDFSLREAFEFAEKALLSNGGLTSTITFSDLLADPLTNNDPTASPEPTILLDQGFSLSVTFPVIIQGPTTYQLEIDAAGNDLTPGIGDGNGSSVFDIFSTAEISDLIIRGGDEQGFGGGIYSAGDATLTNIIVKENFTTGVGAGIYVSSGTVTLDSSTVHDNTAAGTGAGIYNSGGDLTVTSSTISGNIAGLHGGGIANYGGNLLLRYSTVTENTASSTLGSGLASYRNGLAYTQVRSSIISGNTTNDVQHIQFGADSIVSLGYNLVGSGNAVLSGVFSSAGDQTFSDAMLAPLAVLGGSTPVHRLLPGSPAIDAGDSNPAGLGNVPIYDQRGFPFDRIEAGAGSGIIDIGSVETQDDVFLIGDGSMAEGSFVSFEQALGEANISPTAETIVFLDSWPGEIFSSETLEITDSVEIVGFQTGFRTNFFGIPALEILVDDGTPNLIDVSFDRFLFDNNVRFVSRENLSFNDTQFLDNDFVVEDLDLDGIPDNGPGGGAIFQENGSLTIENASFIGNSVATADASLEAAGGAIYASGAAVVINNSFLTGNSTGPLGGSGGALYVKDGSLTSNYLYITGNSATAATAQGGGLYTKNSTVDLTNPIISANVTTGSNSAGGGFAAINSTTTLQNPLIAFNTTTGTQSPGGGMFVSGGSMSIQDGTFLLNQTQGASSPGGAIANNNADLTLERTTINDNTAAGLNSHGGGIYHSGGNLTILSSTLSNNETTEAGSQGGGIYTNTGPLGSNTALLFNSTVSGNTATHQGGGVHNAGGLLQIQYSTITNNSVPFYGNGAGVASAGNGSTSTQVRSSIIAGNLTTYEDPGPNPLPNPDSDVDSVGTTPINSFVSQGYNVIGNGLPLALGAFNQTGDQTGITDPGLLALGFNGGTTQTHALASNSPAVNAGDPNALGIGNVPTTDQRGEARIVATIDIGAFESLELETASFTPTDFDGDGFVTGLDFLQLQRNFGASGATQSQGDSNNDNVVDTADIDNWSADYGVLALSGLSAPSSAAAISAPILAPEPEEAPLASVSTAQLATVVDSSSAESTTDEHSSGLGRLFGRIQVFVTSPQFLGPVVDWAAPFEDLGSDLLDSVSEGVGDALEAAADEVGLFFSRLEDFGEDILDLFDPEESENENEAEDSVFEEMGAAAV